MIDRGELDNFFNSRGVALACPACGHDKPWVRLEDDATIALPVFAERPHAIDVKVVICENCGFMRFHAVEAIMNRIRQPEDDQN